MQRDERPLTSKGTVQIAPGARLWREVLVSAVDYHDMDVEVLVTWSDSEQRLVAARVEARQSASGQPVTTESLRAIAVGQFIRHSLMASVRSGLIDGGAEDEQLRRAFGVITVAAAEQARADGPVEETLRQVALIYRTALAVGDGPTKTVREVFGVSQSTAGAWVAAARRGGHLGESEGRGKAKA